MWSSTQDKETERHQQQRQQQQRKGQQPHPGAFPVSSSYRMDQKRQSLRKIVSRGVDVDNDDQPRRDGKGPMRNDSFIVNPNPPSYLSRRETRRKAACDSSSSMLAESDHSGGGSCDDDDDDSESMALPGAVPVPGIFALSGRGVEINTHTRLSFISTEESSAEAIVAAHLVEDIEIQERNKIRQEIYDEAEQAEIVDTKRQKKCFLLLVIFTFFILAGIGLAVGFVLQPRQEELNNSLCANSAPIFIGDTIRGSVGNAFVGRIETCSPTKPNGDVKGRWFTFLGDGSSITASTCGNTNFDSQISVYVGSSCQSLSCVAFADDSPSCCSSQDWDCNSTAAAVTISTTIGETYYICVHGTNVEADAVFELIMSSSTGTFGNDSVRLL